MTVLHGAWIPAASDADGVFALWGEQAAERVRRGRPPKRRPPGPPVHPFALTEDGVRHALSTLGLMRWTGSSTGRSALARLPSGEAGPWRSTDPPPAVDDLHFAVWQVPTVALSAQASVVFLPRLAAATAANPSVLGHDLRAWIVAARFALSLLARQRLRPDVRLVDGLLGAEWTPVLDEPADRASLAALEASLPPAAVCLSWSASPELPSVAGRLVEYLTAVVDDVARRAPRPRSLPRQPGTAGTWLGALGSTDPIMPQRGDRAAALLRQVKAWEESAPADDTDAAFRLGFRLNPPLADGVGGSPAPWRLDYLLQAADDPSLLVPLGEVWQQRGSTASFLHRRFDQPQERVLAALGRASRLFAPIATSLRSPTPEGCELSVDQAAELVRDSALLLKASGFAVLLPGLEARFGVRLRLHDRPRPATPSGGVGGLSFDRLIEYDWQVALGDEKVTREELEQLARLKTPLVQFRGRWVDIRPDDIERALAFVRGHAERSAITLGEAVTTALAPGSAFDGLPVASVEATGTLDGLLDQLRDGTTRRPFAAPDGLVGELRPYQERGVGWMAALQGYGLGALLADDMGLGKTIQVIALILARREAEAELPPTLVVCPTSVVGNWRHELARFAPELRVHVHHGPDRANAEELVALAAHHDVVISTYALLHRDESRLTRVEWDGLVLDEAQNIKNAATRAAQVASRLPARWRVALTGTPVENRLADLWSIFDVLNPGYLGPAEQFRRRFALPIERASDADAAARLKALTAPFILRRLKTDRSIIADLPEKQVLKVYCTLTREQASLYEAVVRQSLDDIAATEGIQRRGQVLALLTKLKQVCDHPALLLHDGSRLPDRSGKLERIVDMLGEVIALDERALVFSQYAEMGSLLREHLASALDREVLFLHGATPMAERDRIVARFQSEQDGPPVLVLSLRAGGTGLNLTRANHVFHFDRWWNPAVENQATDRAFRIGQTRNVQVHTFLCAGTFEESLDELIERKLRLAESIVGVGEAWITEMSTAELRDLFTLRREAVS